MLAQQRYEPEKGGRTHIASPHRRPGDEQLVEAHARTDQDVSVGPAKGEEKMPPLWWDLDHVPGAGQARPATGDPRDHRSAGEVKALGGEMAVGRAPGGSTGSKLELQLDPLAR